MAARETSRALPLLTIAALVGLGCAACASSSKPVREPLPPRAVAPETPAPPASEPPVAVPSKPATVVVLDPGEDGAAETAPTLAEAAARERERRRTAEKPIAVIDDKNLAEFARDQKLTIAQGEPEAESAATQEAPLAGDHDEAWWRNRGLEIRREWRHAVDSMERLEGEVAELRNRFYATDDPYVRDAQVKPEWDRRLSELEDARRKAADGRHEVERFLEEGRRAGALPGWLREGVELEPEPVLPRVEDAEPGEPVILGEDPPP
jgi:hypothetical protein